MPKPIVLENEFYRIEVTRPHGLITRIFDKKGRIELIADSRLAENFRLLLPLAEYECNYILGSEQRLSAVDQQQDSLELNWKGPLRNAHGKWNLDVTLWIELAGEAIHFRCVVKNRTKHPLGEVWYPIIGGMMGLGDKHDRRDTEVILPAANTNWRKQLFRDFGNTRGQALGTLSGEHGFTYPGFMSMPWASLFHEKRNRAFYFAGHETIARVKQIRFAMDPGLADQREGGNWPREDEVGSLPTALR